MEVGEPVVQAGRQAGLAMGVWMGAGACACVW